MKTINKFKTVVVSLCCSLSLLSSCDLLYQPPMSDLTADSFWKSADDARVGTLAIYAAMAEAMSPGMWNWGELRSDSYIGNPKDAYDQVELTSNTILNDNAATRWTYLYQVVGRANAALKYIPKISMTTADKNQYMAEAYALRAWAYFYLVRVWGDVPLFLEPVETLSPEMYRPRTDAGYILENVILSDLEKAYQFINKTAPTTTAPVVRTHINPATVCVLLMDVHAWMGNYDKVISIYDERVTLLSKSYYGLLDVPTSANWRAMFQETGTPPALTIMKEVLFKIAYEKQGAKHTNSAITYFGSSTPKVTVSQYVKTALFESGDWRKAASFDNANDRLNKKFWIDGANLSGSGSTRVYSNLDLTLYRYADIVLLYAEALAKVDRFADAVFELNKISSRAGSKTYHVSEFIDQSELIDAILLERHREFLGEGKRWFDLVRCNRVELVKAHTGVDILMPRQKYIPIHRDHINQNNLLVPNPY